MPEPVQRDCCDTTEAEYHLTDCPTGRGKPAVIGIVTHDRCNALCNGDNHYLIHDHAPQLATEVEAAFGEGWTELGYITEEGL